MRKIAFTAACAAAVGLCVPADARGGRCGGRPKERRAGRTPAAAPPAAPPAAGTRRTADAAAAGTLTPIGCAATPAWYADPIGWRAGRYAAPVCHGTACQFLPATAAPDVSRIPPTNLPTR